MDDLNLLVNKLQNLLGSGRVRNGSRLPPERSLAAELGVSRAALRKALLILVQEGRIWRHVGQGTFLGPRPDATPPRVPPVALATNPTEIMEARLLLEPKLAGTAALRATMNDFSQMEACLAGSRGATDLAALEYWDHLLHLTIAGATDNSILISFFGMIHKALESDIWGSLKKASWTPERRRVNLQQHEELVRAMMDRDAARADRIMRDHLETIKKNLLEFPPGEG